MQRGKIHRVFVTGMGQCSSLGTGVEEFWRSLINQESGIRTLRMKGIRGLGATLTTICQGDDRDRLKTAIHNAICEAIEDAKFTQLRDLTVTSGSNFGDHYRFLETGDFFHSLRVVIRELGIYGGLWGVSTACASGVNALGLAYDLIRYGEKDRVLVCSYDLITPYNYIGLNSLRAITRDTIRPFDRNRSGTLLGEAVAVLILESASCALSRNVRIYVEVLGYGISNDAYHSTAPEPTGRGIQTAMRQALQDAGLSASSIDHLNAHGTGTIHNDRIETLSVHKIFGRKAKNLPVTSIKPAVGHTMGAAGTIESIATILSIRDGIIPPILNFQEYDPDCDLNYIFNKPIHISMNRAMCNSYGLWGCNASIILGRADRLDTQCRNTEKGNTESRIIITGLGPVSSLGIGTREFIKLLQNGGREAKRRQKERFIDIKGFNVHDHLKLKTQCLDRATGMALVAAALAIDDAGWNGDDYDPERLGIIIGTAYGNMSVLERYRRLKRASPLQFLHSFINTTGGLTSKVLQLQGVHSVLCSGPLAGLQSVWYATKLLISNKADRIVAGGTDSLSSIYSSCYRSAPWLKEFASESAGMIAIERKGDHGKPFYAEILGIGICSAGETSPSLFEQALQAAIDGSGINESSLDMIIPATAQDSRYGDIERTALIHMGIEEKQWFGLADVTGDVGAAYGGLSIILASLILNKRSDIRYIAINGLHDHQCISIILKGAEGV